MTTCIVAGLAVVVAPITAEAAGTLSETAGGPAHTWTNPANAGGIEGPTVGGGQTVQIACVSQGFRVQDGNTNWYRIAEAPWSNQYWVSADAFYNNGATSGSLRGTPFVDPAVPDCSTLQTGWNETTGGVANTWSNPANAGGIRGATVPANQTVVISCRLSGFTVADGNSWWYRIASSPWTDQFYVSADAFYNNGAVSGSLRGTPFVDPAVADCGGSSAGTGGNKPSPVVRLAQGPTAPAGYRYAISLTGFNPNASVSIRCFDSVDTGGFYTFSLKTNSAGAASTASYCYSGDGPDHWVTAGGVVSNHLAWAGSSGAGSGSPVPPAGPPPAGTSQPSVGYHPVKLKLPTWAGTRERKVAAYSSTFNSVSKPLNIDAQSVARIIYHEGGNYLGSDARRTGIRAWEYNFTGSVGIGQIVPATAKLVCLVIYRDFGRANEEDVVMRIKLIDDEKFSIKIAAGYVKMLEKAGISGSYEQFMSYSLSIDGAKKWKSMGYTLDARRLATISKDTPAVFAARAQFFREAVAAIG